MLTAKAVGRFAEVGREECCSVAVPYLDHGKDAVDFVLELAAQLVNVLGHQLLIDLKAARLRVEE